MWDNPGHPLCHVPCRGTTDQKLEAISQHLQKKIIVYDENGKVLYSKGDNVKEPAIELIYHKPEGDRSGEWFSSKGGNETPYRLHDPNDQNLYNIIGNQTKCDPDKLMSTVTDNINKIPIDESTPCIENYSSGGNKSGFLSQADMNYVTHNALLLEKAKEKMNELNTNAILTKTDCRKELIVPVEELGITRTIYGQKWKKGRPIGQIKPVKSITIVLQHQDGKENDPDAPVHIQTLIPRL
ncbi:hypothetical protein WN55_08785 [Dufourea novaeangliae]|uniref:Uncharacterized protein n=1 Tax=Dufourea novaeangliae TaxID=178035 RepID=A0A154P1R7_DUFNO|nr:hypothetical protein WN55_08785 [Dufourea novaeangliae]